MRVHQSLKTLISSLVVASLLMPQAQMVGSELPAPALLKADAERSPGTSASDSPFNLDEDLLEPQRKKSRIADIALDSHGILHGSFTDQLGLPLPGTLVVARQGKTKVRTTHTDGRGAFAMTGLKGGIWEITVGSQSTSYRVWAAEIAPPIAQSKILVTRQAMVVRGQSEDTGMLAAFDAGTLFSVGAGVAGITLGTIGISEAAEANDEADDLRRELNALSATVDAISATLN